MEENEKMINEIIRGVVNIYFFRLAAQEPIDTWDWLPKGTEVNTLRMDGCWNRNELENLRIDICAFPLIGFNLSHPDEKVMFPAQVIVNFQ